MEFVPIPVQIVVEVVLGSVLVRAQVMIMEGVSAQAAVKEIALVHVLVVARISAKRDVASNVITDVVEIADPQQIPMLLLLEEYSPHHLLVPLHLHQLVHYTLQLRDILRHILQPQRLI